MRGEGLSVMEGVQSYMYNWPAVLLRKEGELNLSVIDEEHDLLQHIYTWLPVNQV